MKNAIINWDEISIMQGKSKFILLYLVFTSIINSTANISGHQSQNGTIKVGIDINFAPYEWAEDCSVFGFNVDLITLLAEKAGYSVEFYPTLWSNILEGVENGTLDVFFGQPQSNHPDFIFSSQYLDVYANMFTQYVTTDIDTLNDLAYRTVSVGRDYPTHLYLMEQVPNAILIPVDTVQQGIDLLVNREVFVFFGATHASQYYIQSRDITHLKIIGDPIDMGSMNIGLSKNNTELLTELNNALETIQSNGEFNEIYEQWFGKPLPRTTVFFLPPWLVPAIIGLSLIVPALFWRNRQLIQAKHKVNQAYIKINKLSGLIPICPNCKNVRDDKGFWEQVETFVRDHSEAEFSHGICPECMESLYGDYIEKMES